MLRKKPLAAADAPERRGKGGPFIDPDPDFVLGRIGESHVLELSMYCAVRPLYVLHTKLFAPQTDDLTMDDFIAMRAVMVALRGDTPYLTIYNCGVEAGSSRGHKHMQIFPLPEAFEPFPGRANLGDGTSHRSRQDSSQPLILSEISTNISGIPFRHYVLPLHAHLEPRHIQRGYERLMAEMRSDRSANPAAPGSPDAYNFMMTESWMCVVPRRFARRGDTPAGAGGMLGVQWVADEAERARWTELGFSDHLAQLGVPLDCTPPN